MQAPIRAVVLALLLAGSGTVAAQGAATPLASQDTNWEGVVADLTEFKRKGNTLTVKLKLRNTGSAEKTIDIAYEKTYVLDADNGKKYEVLTDDQRAYIAATQTYHDRYYDSLKPGESASVWMKFPAPPATTKSASLTVAGMAPFDDVTIQDQ
jgi:hypothetical protein